MVGLTDVAAVVGTYLVFAAFLSLTAHVAARNVVGDVRADQALLVGPFPAAVSFLFLGLLGTQAYVAGLAVPVAIAVDLAAIRRSYDLSWRLAGYVVFIHAVVSIILGTVIGASLTLVARGPPSGAPAGAGLGFW